jgi:hypothetical protein
MLDANIALEVLRLVNRSDWDPETITARADKFVSWIESKATPNSGSSTVVDRTPDELGTSQKTITLAKAKKSG